MASQAHDEDGTPRPDEERSDRAKRVQSMLDRWAGETVTEPDWDIDGAGKLTLCVPQSDDA